MSFLQLSNGFLNGLVDYIMITLGARLEKLFCNYAKNIIICPSAQTDPSSFRYMITLFSKYSMYNLSKSLPIPGRYIHQSLSLTWSETVSKGLLAMKK